MAPWRVSTPAKGVPVGREGITPDLVEFRRTGAGGGASVTWATELWASTRAARPRGMRMDLCMIAVECILYTLFWVA
jgi:hypothetical protein